MIKSHESSYDLRQLTMAREDFRNRLTRGIQAADWYFFIRSCPFSTDGMNDLLEKEEIYD